MPNCLVCETPDATGSNPGVGDFFRIDCKRCGELAISGTATAMLSSAFSECGHRRALMSHTIRRMIGIQTGSRPPMIVSDKLENYWPTDRLPTPSTQADQLILLSGDSQLSPEDPIRFAGHFLNAWVGTSLTRPDHPHEGVEWLLSILQTKNYCRVILSPEQFGFIDYN